MPASKSLNSNQKGFAPVFVVFVLTIIVVLGGVLVYTKYYNNQKEKLQPPFQTQKECEDKTGKKCSLNMCQVSESSTPSADWDCKSGFYPIENLTSTPTPRETANWKTYVNTKYGYSFNYPPDSENVSLGNFYISMSNPKTGWIFISLQGRLSEDDIISFKEFAKESALNTCAADGATESINCDKVVKEIPIATKNGIKGYQFYLNYSRSSLEKDGGWRVKHEKVVGPILVYDITKQTDDYSLLALMIYTHYAEDLDEEGKTIIEGIGSSVRVNPIPEETGTETSCTSNKDCWCMEFTGSEFIPGKKVEGVCDTKLNLCQQCIYY